MSIVGVTEIPQQLIDQLYPLTNPQGKIILDQLAQVVRWSDRHTAAIQLSQTIASGLSRPTEIADALEYLKDLTETRFRPVHGQKGVVSRDIRSFFSLVRVVYDAHLYEAASEALELYSLIFPNDGEKVICGHPSVICECGIIPKAEISSPFCPECGRVRTLCQAPALHNGRCLDHGGRIPEGMSRGTIYRQYMSDEDAAAHATMELEAGISLNAEIAMASMQLAKLSAELSQNSPAEMRMKLFKLQRELQAAGDDVDRVADITNEMGNVLDENKHGSKPVRDQMNKWLLVLAKLTEQERENRKASAEFISIEDHDRIVDELYLTFRAGLDRVMGEARRKVSEFIVSAMREYPGAAPIDIAGRVTTAMLEATRVIEGQLIIDERPRLLSREEDDDL